MELIKSGKENPEKKSEEQLPPPGARINQIQQDMKSKDMGANQKALRYSQHLAWFLEKVQELYRLQMIQGNPGIWDQSPYMHGMFNGLVMAMSVILEDPGPPPFKKIPEKYIKVDGEEFKTPAYQYIESLESLLAAVYRRDEHGPWGYGHHQDPWGEWMAAADIVLDSSIFTNKQMGDLRRRMKEWKQENP